MQKLNEKRQLILYDIIENQSMKNFLSSDFFLCIFSCYTDAALGAGLRLREKII